jgi:ribosomal protein L11 methylase PrmA
MQQPKIYEVTHIDEVEEVKLQFSKFFKQSTDNSHLNIPSKLDNIYNQDEINKNSRRDLIVSNLLARKIVMIYEEFGGKNFMNEKYQNK